MDITLPAMERIRIEGIKLSNELVLLNSRNISSSMNTINRLCQILAANQINMPFLSTICLHDKLYMSCCVTSEDKFQVKLLIDSEADLRENIKLSSAVGLISIFPHQSSLKLFGLSLYAFGKARLPIYGTASSLSALTFITDYASLDQAAASLEEYFELPPNQRPFRPQIRVTQSSVGKER
jgi:aspartokinase